MSISLITVWYTGKYLGLSSLSSQLRDLEQVSSHLQISIFQIYKKQRGDRLNRWFLGASSALKVWDLFVSSMAEHSLVYIALLWENWTITIVVFVQDFWILKITTINTNQIIYLTSCRKRTWMNKFFAFYHFFYHADTNLDIISHSKTYIYSLRCDEEQKKGQVGISLSPDPSFLFY